nr:hypothetical protein [uncultured Lacibacter sp.]
MMKKVTTLFIAVLVCTAAAQAQNISTVIKTEALNMGRALAVMDFDAYSKYMYPSLVLDKTSKEKMRQGLDSVEKYRQQFGIKVKQILMGNPSEVQTYKGVMQCTLPQTTTIESIMGTVSFETTLIGLSHDGKKWYFADAMLYRQQETKAKLPELSPKLVIPAQKAPVMKPNEEKNKN